MMTPCLDCHERPAVRKGRCLECHAEHVWYLRLRRGELRDDARRAWDQVLDRIPRL